MTKVAYQSDDKYARIARKGPGKTYTFICPIYRKEPERHKHWSKTRAMFEHIETGPVYIRVIFDVRETQTHRYYYIIGISMGAFGLVAINDPDTRPTYWEKENSKGIASIIRTILRQGYRVKKKSE